MNPAQIKRILLGTSFFLTFLTGCQQQGEVLPREITFHQNQAGVYRVMTLNIRQGGADDGVNGWEHRRGLVFDVLAEYAGDVMGLQEALDFQVDQIQRALGPYGHVAAGRDDGKRDGEACAIFYRRDRFALADSGTFWFSNSPWKPSTHWGNGVVRICTWVRLTERGTGNRFYVYNVHLDHRSQVSRVKSAKLLAKEIANRATDDPFIVLGDFNMEMDNPAMLYLQKIGVDTPYPRLVDTWRMLYRAGDRPGTFHGFKGQLRGPNVDHILVRDDTDIIEVGLDRRSFGGRYPSDHFPVYAEIRLFGP